LALFWALIGGPWPKVWVIRTLGQRGLTFGGGITHWKRPEGGKSRRFAGKGWPKYGSGLVGQRTPGKLKLEFYSIWGPGVRKPRV